MDNQDVRDEAKYRTVSIPADFFSQVEEYVKKTPRFRSVADFARTAMYEKLQQERLFPGQTIDLQKTYDEAKEIEAQQIEKLVDKKIDKKLRSLFKDSLKKK